MIKLYRIKALFLRYMLQVRDTNRLFEMTLWPAFDALVGGVISLWMVRDMTMQQAALIPVFGMFFWQIVTRAYTDLGANTLEDIWSKNVSNLFGSPLMYEEWIISLMIFSLLRALWVGVLCAAVIYYFFGVSITMFGWWLLPLMSILVVTGWGFGCYGAAMALLFGNRALMFVFSFWIFIPLCGTLYPIDILPSWLQLLSALLPMTYVFSAVQLFIMTGTMPITKLMVGVLLSMVNIMLGLIVCRKALSKSKKAGLARLEAE